MAETKNITIRVKAVGDKALKAIAKDMKKVSKNAKSLKRNFSGLRNVFLGVFAGRGIKAVVGMADSIQLLGDRINAFVGDTEKGAVALDTLFQAADLTNQSIDTLAEGFNRIALSTQELGLSTEEMIGFTTTLQNAFRIQGASAAEATGATIQLTQGLSSGSLRGQELRSVLEASSVAADVLAKSVGIGRGQLIKFAESGAFTSEVVLKAFSSRALELNERASKLGTTFGQTLTKAMNRSKKGINEVNKDAGLSKKFEASVLGAVDAIEKMVISINRSDGFGKFITFMGDYVKVYSELASKVFGTESPLEKVNRQLSETVDEVDRLEKSKDKLENGFNIANAIASIFTTDGASKRSFRDDAIKNTEDLIKDQKTLFKILSDEKDKILGLDKKTRDAKPNAALEALKAFSKANISKSLDAGTLSLKKLNIAFNLGNVTAKEYERIIIGIQKSDISNGFKEGKTSLEEYNKELDELNRKLAKVEGNFNPIQDGAEKALKNIGEFSEEVSDLVANSFSTLEDSIVDFAKTGKFAFADFAQSVLDDMTRIIVRQQIIAPLLGAFTGASVAQPGDASFVGPVRPNAKGNAFVGGRIQAFASGGIVDSPSYFPMKGGTGLMGEAGPEAIVPLTRTATGELGVQALPNNIVVNVNNTSGAEIDIQESSDGNSKVLDITIARAVNSAIGQGRFDKSLSSNFGLNRKGSK